MCYDLLWKLVNYFVFVGFFQRRCRDLRNNGLHFVGCGVSGGEDGARYGPSIMPGGDEEAW